MMRVRATSTGVTATCQESHILISHDVKNKWFLQSQLPHTPVNLMN